MSEFSEFKGIKVIPLHMEYTIEKLLGMIVNAILEWNKPDFIADWLEGYNKEDFKDIPGDKTIEHIIKEARRWKT